MPITETLTDNVDGSASPVINHTSFDKTISLDAAGSGSSGPIVAAYVDEIDLVAGAFTLDLTALPQSGGGTFDGTTMKVQGFRVEYPTVNANTLLIATGASNGYDIFGGATHEILLSPGCLFQAYWDDKLQDISATDKTIDFTGTGTENFFLTLLVG